VYIVSPHKEDNNHRMLEVNFTKFHSTFDKKKRKKKKGKKGEEADFGILFVICNVNKC